MRRLVNWARCALTVTTCVTTACNQATELESAGPAATPTKVAETAAALSGREGKIDYAIDAPFRLEPVGWEGHWDHGPIPITISLHDANLASADGNYDYIRDLLRIVIKESSPGGVSARTVRFDELREVEATRGPWRLTGVPEHEVCEPALEDCIHLSTVEGTSAWHATYWYQPRTGAVAGDDIELEVELQFAAGLRFYEWTGDGSELVRGPGVLKLVDHLKIHLGDKPLPRFGEGWLYGDLHYHSQNTDNEGEAGYGYRSTLRAMGSLGLDFAFATEHASNSRQIADFDIDLDPFVTDTLRDMSPDRFRFGLDSLHGADGANTAVLTNPAGLLAQNIRGRSVAPQLFLGGEVDAIPEVRPGEVGTFPYGNGLTLDIEDFCVLPTCDAWDNVTRSPDGNYGVVGWAGGGEENTRQHLVYMPSAASDRNAFVASNTTRFGGGGRWLPDVLENIRAHGYAFLAHPINGSTSGPSDFGPDMFPYGSLQLRRAFESPAILGLQLWNEDNRLVTEIGEGESFNTGRFTRDLSTVGTEQGPAAGRCQRLTNGGLECLLELQPAWKKQGFQWQRSGTPSYAADDTDFGMSENGRGLYSQLHHGTFTLDTMLRQGLDPARTANLSWLPAGEPRRVFMAGGSDAHGDLSYRREGYFFGTTEVTSTAIGTPRNLVYAGAVRPPRPRAEDGDLTPVSVSSVPTTNKGEVAENPNTDITLVQAKARTVDASSVKVDVGAKEASSIVSKFDSSTVASSVEPATLNSGAVAITSHGKDQTVIVGAELPKGADEVFDPGSPRPVVRYGQTQVVDALRSGNFSVTDGPALRIVIDRNRNGAIDDADIPMGGIAHLYGDQNVLPLLVEWKSSKEFGPVANIDLYLGSVRGAVGRTYAPGDHGVRSPVDPQSTRKRDVSHWDGQLHTEMLDNYFLDKTGTLRIDLPRGNGERSYEGVRAVNIDLRRFPASISEREGQGTGFYVRAFAKTEPERAIDCTGRYREFLHRRGECLERLAYTNPVWALRKVATTGCPADPRAFDADMDGEPEHCDACPGVAGPNCVYDPPAVTNDWSRRFGGPQLDEALTVATDDEGNVFVAGHFSGSVQHGTVTYVSEGAYDGFVAKYSPSGALRWVKQLGGTGDMRILGLVVDSHGDPILTGWFNGQVIFDAEHTWTSDSPDVFVLDLYGRHYTDRPVVRWSRFLRGPGHTEGRALALDENGRILVGGSFQGSIATGSSGVAQGGTGSDCYVVTLNPASGDETLHIAGSGNCEVTGIVTQGSDIIVAGRYSGQLSIHSGVPASQHTSLDGWNGFLARFRDGRFYEWLVTLGDDVPGCAQGDTRLNGLDTDAQGILYAVGYTSQCLGFRGPSQGLLASGLSGYQPFVARVTPEGRVFGGAGLGVGGLASAPNRFANAVAVAADGSYVVTGSVSASADTRTKRTNHDGWLARYAPDTNLLWSEQFGSMGLDYSFACDLDAEGHVAVAGRFAGSLAIGDASWVSEAGGGDAFVARLSR